MKIRVRNEWPTVVGLGITIVDGYEVWLIFGPILVRIGTKDAECQPE